jgi:hypothetical protein
MTPKMILENWGNWNRVDTGKPQGYPSTSPMFANHPKFSDPGWGDSEAAPEPARPPINVALAERADEIIGTMEMLPKMVLINEFYLRSHKFRRMGGAEYCVNLQAAIDDFAARFSQPTGKAQVITLLETKPTWKTRYIAAAAGVTTAYVRRIRSEIVSR